MSTLRRLALVMLAVPAVAACGPQAPAALSPEDRAAINAIRDTYVQSDLADDPAGIAALYAPNGILMVNHQQAVAGPSAIEQFYAGGDPPSALTVSSAEVAGAGDLAYDHGTYTITMSPPEAPSPITDSGHYVALFGRQPDGSWKITHLIINSDQPLPTGEGM